MRQAVGLGTQLSCNKPTLLLALVSIHIAGHTSALLAVVTGRPYQLNY